MFGQSKGRRILWLGAILAIGLGVSSVPLIQFYQGFWKQVTTLPQIVRTTERQHGGRYVPLSDVSPWVVKALVATEDRTFYSNFGVSLEGISRSLLVDLGTGSFTQGGSTLTQQLVRNTMLTPAKHFRRKLSEALLSVEVTLLYNKQEILTLYLNRVYLGDGAYGVYAASHRYFGLSPRQLSLPQASLLAGLPQAPSALDPLVHYQAAKHRQWEVLTSMVADHVISWHRAHEAFGDRLSLVRKQGV